MSRHTPGPWGVDGKNRTRVAPFQPGGVFLDFDRQVATVRARGGQFEVTKANAMLIAAAPEMLAALELAASYCGESGQRLDDSPLAEIREAIDKATTGIRHDV